MGVPTRKKHMQTIAFVTQKGGAGKSTLASGVAVAARAAGERVFIIDLDPLQTLVKWSSSRKDPEIGV
jgi:chromosome partitioning protein